MHIKIISAQKTYKNDYKGKGILYNTFARISDSNGMQTETYVKSWDKEYEIKPGTVFEVEEDKYQGKISYFIKSVIEQSHSKSNTDKKSSGLTIEQYIAMHRHFFNISRQMSDNVVTQNLVYEKLINNANFYVDKEDIKTINVEVVNTETDENIEDNPDKDIIW